jgi:hypothetical protein
MMDEFLKWYIKCVADKNWRSNNGSNGDANSRECLFLLVAIFNCRSSGYKLRERAWQPTSSVPHPEMAFARLLLVSLIALIASAMGQSIISPLNGTYYQSGDSVQTVISDLQPGLRYRLAFYPTTTGQILSSLNFTANSEPTQYYYVYLPLEFSGEGTIQLLSYADQSVPAFVNLNVTPRPLYQKSRASHSHSHSRKSKSIKA